MTTSCPLNVDGIFNVSNTTVANDADDYLGSSTSEITHPVTVAESLQTTRFVVQNILTPVIVTVGLLGNSLNILVLFQPSMRTSTNVYLLVLSLADSVFLVFNFALSLLDCRKRDLFYSAYHFNPYGRFISNFSGNVAVWVTVVFTVERYIAVCHPIHGKVWCTVHRAKLASLSVGLLALVNTVPTMFELEVVHTPRGPVCRPTSFAENVSYEIGYSWWYVTVFTFIPLTCLAIFNFILIRALLIANQKRQQLTLVATASSGFHQHNGKNTTHTQIDFTFSESGTNSSPTRPSLSTNRKYRQSKRVSREQNKVTLMLITIVMIFLLCQLPWTALYLYLTYLSTKSIKDTGSGAKIAGNICNILQLVNASVNFYLYSCFSKRFRRTLAKLMLFWRRWTSSPIIM